MATFRISGVWKNDNNVITHYAIHTVNNLGTTRAVKTTKADAIRLLEVIGNSAKTWLWNYSRSFWSDGENVEVVNGRDGKYLRSDRNDTTKDNLAHLINYNWL